MKPEENPEKFKELETKLGHLSRVTLSQTFPTWDELSRRSLKYPELYEAPKSRPNLIAFPKRNKIWIGTGLLAAASLSLVFLLNRGPVGESKVQVAEVAPAFASVPGPKFELVIGFISQSKGKNYLRKSDASESPLAKGSEVVAGERVIVGKAGSLDLTFANHVYLRVLPETEIEIVDSKSMFDSTQQLIRVWKGKVLFTLGKLKKDSSFQVATGDFGTVVRGTTFSVSYDGKSKHTIAVRDGSVSIVSPEATESVLEPGKQIQISDHVASIPSTILPKDDKEMKALQTQVSLAREAKLYEEYSRLELVRMEDGTEYRGVIMGQSATHLQLESLDGPMEIPIGKILETEKIR